MKKNEFKGLDLTYYTEKLENGLEVVLIPMTDKKNYFITYATRFGSEITSFTPVGKSKEIKVPDGIAHFLEHKMFEEESGEDPFTFFSKSGTGANASTSFDNTQYICYGTKKFEENLRYLLKFVNSPYFTDANVEKEKGIIAEEINMYDDIPDFRLEMKLRENLFHTSPRRIDIGGSVKEIKKITKEDLYTCYNNFYSPNNMFIIVVGNFNYKEASKIITEEMELRENMGTPKVKTIHEKKEVKVKNETVKYQIEVPKLALGLKIKKLEIDELDKCSINYYLAMLTTLLFGSSSLFNEKALSSKLYTDLVTDWEYMDDYDVFYLMATTEYPEDLLKEIQNTFKNKEIDEESFERIKKVWIANNVRKSDDVNSMVQSSFSDLILHKEIIDNKIERIRNLDFDTLQKVIEKIDFNNTSSVIMIPKK